MGKLSAESRQELDALLAEIRSEGRTRRLTEEERRRELARIAELARAGRVVVDLLTRRSRYFATRAGRVYHTNLSCPALWVCEVEEIIFVPDPSSDRRADRDCLRCAGFDGRTLDEIAREARRYAR